ncbi:hypothetical protein FRC00_009360 [Tulasnella sp. 408]|nr:hypothetical protein FRC00_009360 [Tulasnella sp. 408]
MDLAFESDEQAANFIRRLLTPQCLRASLDITLAVENLDQYVADYCQFVSPRDNCIPCPNSATILINSHGPGLLQLFYGTESHRISFIRFSGQGALTFHNVVQELQTSLKEPSLNVTVTQPSVYNVPFLKSLWDQNIRSIVARECERSSLHALFSAIGESSVDALTDTPESTAITWPFESLKSLTIYDADLNVSQITRLVGIRQQYLQENSKRWLEEIVLVNCRLKGMRLAKAVKQLTAIGVTLRSVACSRAAVYVLRDN